MSGPRALHRDVAAYALGVLEPADRRAVRAHLGDCPRCTRELAELSGVVAALLSLAEAGPCAPGCGRNGSGTSR